MGVQTIKGILTDGDDAPLANVVAEIQFSYGASQVTGPGVRAQTDDDGAFSVDVFNNADGVDTVAITVADKIIHTFDFDPEEAEVDVGTVIMETDIGGRPRLISAEAAAVDLEPKNSTTVIAPDDKTYLLQSDFEVSGLESGIEDNNARYTYRGVHNGKPFYNRADIEAGDSDPLNNAISFDDGDNTWRFFVGGDDLFSSPDNVDYPWEIGNWDALGAFTVPPVCLEKPEAKEITVAGLFAAHVLQSHAAEDIVYNDDAVLGDTPLSVPVVSEGIYRIELLVRSVNVAQGLRLDFGGTATVTNFVGQWTWQHSDGNGFVTKQVTSAAEDFEPNAAQTVGGLYTFNGTIEVNAGGTFLLRGAQDITDASDTKILKGSTLVLTKMN